MLRNKSEKNQLICRLVQRLEERGMEYADLLTSHLTRQDYVRVTQYLTDHVHYPALGGEWSDE